jgi:hypothetical protein
MKAHFVASLSLWLLLSTPFTARATLGGAPTYPQMKATTRVQSHFSEHTGLLGRFTLHQYTGRDGNVFAVAWRGKTHPDMRALLGDNYSAYMQTLTAARHRHHGHAPLTVEAFGLHVELGGHMRSVYGRIWIINKLPPAVDTNDIQ